jgi:1-aminocyclopropane-1-carboxylate deaminase/D-cysteine desulfhydrase-like pyridoxal-dependent ACC family enzyme
MHFRKKPQLSSAFMTPTPISKFFVDGREFYVKRDELFDRFLSGNKFRKLQKLIETPKEKYKRLISYGGTQSNAMLSIAALAHKKGWEFIYYTKKLSTYQKLHVNGNYKYACEFGMVHKELQNSLYHDFIASLTFESDVDTLLLHQGGADVMAAYGISALAHELQKQLSGSGVEALATPSGTGTTAFYLAKALPDYRLYTLASIGNADYLREQMHALGEIPKNLIILEPSKKYRFAKPYKEFYEMYTKLKNCGITFDLLYAPLLWQELLTQTDEKICYIHSGGIFGNDSMLPRYERIL